MRLLRAQERESEDSKGRRIIVRKVKAAIWKTKAAL